MSDLIPLARSVMQANSLRGQLEELGEARFWRAATESERVVRARTSGDDAGERDHSHLPEHLLEKLSILFHMLFDVR